MSGKPKARGDQDSAPAFDKTYVLDENELEELDDASLTTVMRDVTEALRRIELEQERRGIQDDEIDDLD